MINEVFACLYYAFIMPLVIVMEFVFSVTYSAINNPGLSIICISIVVNILCFPLYKRAEDVQREERDIQKRMDDMVKHIKKSFHGDERFMMLQEYYRLNHYSPVYSLRGVLPLLLQIPFFIAAYTYLSGLSLLNGAGFLFIKNLGVPDGLINVSGMTLNVLPVLMTLINLISGYIYTKGLSFKDKAQVYIIALVFLVFLYDRPSGLVFYWTLNNLFSLAKNIVLKSVPEKEKKPDTSLPFFEKIGNSGKIFICAALWLTVVYGMLIPMSVVSASPDEFVELSNYINPVFYVVSTTFISAGFFLIWGGVIVWFFGSKKVRQLQMYVMLLLSVTSFVNYMFFSRNFGFLSVDLDFSGTLSYPLPDMILNVAALAVVIVVVTLCLKIGNRVIPAALSVLIIGGCIFTVYNSIIVNQLLSEEGDVITANKFASVTKENAEKFVRLSRNGKNVVVILLDRAISGYIPYMFNERPSLQDQFSGFVYYPNTISFGEHTNFGAPAVYGGYEYTPDKINKRVDVSMEQKVNESDLLMPLLFSKEGYTTTICDPAYAGYRNTPDLSIYDEYPEIHSYNTKRGEYTNLLSKDELASRHNEIKYKKFFWYSVYKAAPLFLQEFIYDNGEYFSTTDSSVREDFLKNYTVLKNLPLFTDISDDTKGSFFMIHNNTTHKASLLQLPDYVPTGNINNSGIEGPHRYTASGEELNIYIGEKPNRSHYHVNMSAFIQLGKWFDMLKKEGIYDNTRIILVSDHGYDIGQFDNMKINDELDVQGVNPLLMVKDFNATGFTEDDTFMTNADVPSIAMNDIIDDPVNPFTGNKIDRSAKETDKLLITLSKNANLSEQKWNVFDTMGASWYSVKDNIFDKNNWVFEGNFNAADDGKEN